MLTNLEVVKKYKNQDVINRFAKEYPIYAKEADQIFEDLMTFFWATYKLEECRKQNPTDDRYDFLFIMDAKMKMIDEMWHIFLLFTRPYMSFCQNYFGVFIHHTPNIAPTLPQDDGHYANNLRKFLEFTVDYLDEATLRRWFDVFETDESATA